MSAEVVIKRRSASDELRYLAAKLHEGVAPVLVALCLEVLADDAIRKASQRDETFPTAAGDAARALPGVVTGKVGPAPVHGKVVR
jgi:hypothetical protein